jgi:predicted GNAT family N-acyltransferase
MSVADVTLAVESDQERVFALLQRIGNGPKAVAEKRLGFSELHQDIMELEDLVLHLDHYDESVKTILEGLSPEEIIVLNESYRFWQSRLESHFAHRIIRGEAFLSDYRFYERFAALVQREIALLGEARPQRVLFIGTGPLPLSALLVHVQTGASVDCVARDEDSARVARQVVDKCGFGQRVGIEGTTEADYDVSGYDLVVVELLAQPRKSILTKLRKRCSPGCSILCRTSHGHRQILHKAVPERDMRGFHIKNELIADGDHTVSTCWLEPAGRAASLVRLHWLRSVDSDTAAKLLRLMNRTLEEETTIGFPGPIDEKTGMALMEQLGSDVETGRRHVLVAEKDDSIVGQLILTPNSSPNHHHIVELTRGTIHPSFRGGGLSLRAFHEVAKKCDELGREVICLDVRAGTLAALWWQHFGFKPYGLLADYSRVGGKKYQGLYLMQTNDELKQRLSELAAASPLGASA